MSLGPIHNSTRRAHRNGVVLVAFLAIPKGRSYNSFTFLRIGSLSYVSADRQYQNDTRFRQFRRQLFHASLNFILQSLCPGMSEPEIVRCADGHFRRVIYGIGPYIADYPEQVLLACIVQGWCAR